MKHISVFVLIIFSFCVTMAQKVYINTFIGASNYQGDLQANRFTFNQSRLGLGLGLSYELSDKLLIRAGFMHASVSADDKLNNKNLQRNLNFTSSISEGSLGLEYYFRDLYEYTFSPYVFAGVAVYHFDPYTNDSSGVKYFLKPLSTEGEGFYPGRKDYNLTQFAIPFGGGIKVALNDNIRLGIEVGLRKLFTDYLDDVSTNYIDENLLLMNRGPKAVELAFRGGELKNGSAYPADGKKRGGSGYDDWYYFTGVTASFRLGGSYSGGGGNGRNKSQTGCPARVY